MRTRFKFLTGEIRAKQEKTRLVEFLCTRCDRYSNLDIVSNIGSFKYLRKKVKWHVAYCNFCSYENLVDLRNLMD